MAHECSVDGTPAFGLGSCYWHTKIRLRRGEHLTEAELGYIGFTSSTRAPGGRRDASALGISFQVGAVLEVEDTERSWRR